MSNYKIKNVYSYDCYYLGSSQSYNEDPFNIEINNINELTNKVSSGILEKDTDTKVISLNKNIEYNGFKFNSTQTLTNLPYEPQGKYLSEVRKFSPGNSDQAEANPGKNINNGPVKGINLFADLGFQKEFRTFEILRVETLFNSCFNYYEDNAEIVSTYELGVYHNFVYVFDKELLLFVQLKIELNGTSPYNNYVLHLPKIGFGISYCDSNGYINKVNTLLTPEFGYSNTRKTAYFINICEDTEGNNVFNVFRLYQNLTTYTRVNDDLWPYTWQLDNDEINTQVYFYRLQNTSYTNIFYTQISEYNFENTECEYKVLFKEGTETDVSLPINYDEETKTIKLKYFSRNFINNEDYYKASNDYLIAKFGNYSPNLYTLYNNDKYLTSLSSFTAYTKNMELIYLNKPTNTTFLISGNNNDDSLLKLDEISAGTHYYDLWITKEILFKIKLYRTNDSGGQFIIYTSYKVYLNGTLLKIKIHDTEYSEFEVTEQVYATGGQASYYLNLTIVNTYNNQIGFVLNTTNFQYTPAPHNVFYIKGESKKIPSSIYTVYSRFTVYGITTSINESYEDVIQNYLIHKDEEEESGGESNIPENTPDGTKGNYDNNSDKIEIPNIPGLNLYDLNYLGTFIDETGNLLESVISFLLSDNITDSIIKRIVNPFSSISVKSCPFHLSSEDYTIDDMTILGLEFADSKHKVSKMYKDLDFGNIKIEDYFGNFLDFNPFTKYSLYLPFYGVTELDADYVTRATINIKYRVNMLTGETTIYILGSRNELTPYTSILKTLNCNVFETIPIVGNENNLTETLLSTATGIGKIGVGIATSNPTSLVSGAVSIAESVLSYKNQINMFGNITSNNFCCYLKPYLIIERPIEACPSNYGKYKGFTLNVTETLKNLSGFTVASNVIYKSNKLTEEEKDEVKKLLASGVYL